MILYPYLYLYLYLVSTSYIYIYIYILYLISISIYKCNSAKPNGAARTFLLGPTVLNAFCMNCPWPLWNLLNGNSNVCHPCAGAMHGHECSAKFFGLLLGNVESLASISTPFWHGCCAQTSLEIPVWNSFGPRWHYGNGEATIPHSPAWKSLPLAKMAFWLRGAAIIPRQNFLWT